MLLWQRSITKYQLGLAVSTLAACRKSVKVDYCIGILLSPATVTRKAYKAVVDELIYASDYLILRQSCIGHVLFKNEWARKLRKWKIAMALPVNVG